MSFTQQIAAQVLPVLATLVSTVVTAIVGLALSWVRDRAKSQRVKDALGRIDDAAEAAVRDVSNTLVDGLRKDGALTPDARAKLKEAAVEKIRASLGRLNVDGMRGVLGFQSDKELVEFLETKVEQAVFDMKLQKQAVQTAQPVVPIGS
jgi:hypothetical protein